ncbi:hypothetical protein EUX98_g2202 [Antrodiella citrinella]|uniref:beta-glucosidase n=1 Tax=Antrodiella citrinella TaxID=2447956 RepID=A0A4S4N2E6_9APHY|nr:hypothetical protein EUX98_g2202 [Antrodiella citrinella]
MSQHAHRVSDADILLQGWVLKKRRKRMQGFARRYFVLRQSGVLSYSLHPSLPTRDQIQLSRAAISSAPGRKDIHVDSDTATFHIKCLSTEDFNRWMSAFRKFIVQPDNPATAPRGSYSRSMPRTGYYNRAGALVDEIGQTITELYASLAVVSEEELRRRSQSTISKIKADKDRVREHAKEHSTAMLSIFKGKKGNSSQGSSEAPADEHASIAPSTRPSLTPGTSLHRLQTALDALKYQHIALSNLIPVLNPADMGFPIARTSPLPSTSEADEEPPSPQISSQRLSILSNHSDGSIFYDAPEYGAEEFVLESVATEETPSVQLSGSPQAGDDLEWEGSDSDSEPSNDEEPALNAHPPTEAKQQVTYRTQLPSPPAGDEGSLFAVLKKNVGKRVAEELEYHDLLAQAAQSQDPVERICYVAAFAVSEYASTKHRSGRKGFNPMLAETFEDARMKFIGEKVCHNPVILAFHAEGEGWEVYATSGGKTKFWGKSLEIIPQGLVHVKIGKDHYVWTRPSSFMRNLMMGTKYLEHTGKMTIDNQTTGMRCVLDFKEGGYWGPANVIVGSVLSPSGETQMVLEGKWDETVAQKLDSSHYRLLWKINPFPRNAPEYYGFTSFGITLNEITPDLEGHLPPTDSRLRPDVRALEEGRVDVAEEEKLRVEELQRDRRKRGADRQPRWFKQVGEEWQYVGGYWEQRAQGWKDINVAATFNRTLMRQRGAAMGAEFKGKGVHVALGPMMNLMRVPAAGRNWEGGGGDPFLSGELAFETITGLQSSGVQACAKHYINNEQEHFRDSSSSNVDDRTEHELYAHPFLRSVQANVAAVMCSYSESQEQSVMFLLRAQVDSVNGTFSCENDQTLNGILKGEFGFQGYVMSDWWATHSGAPAVNAGLDMTMPGDTTTNSGQTTPPLTQGDMNNRYLLEQDSGFPAVNFDAWQSSAGTHVNVQADHADLIRTIGDASTVLLKNSNNALPFTNSLKSIAVIGNGATNSSKGPNGISLSYTDRGGDDGVLAMGWGSGTDNFPYLVAPVDAITARTKPVGITVTSSLSDTDLTGAANAAANKDVALVFITADSGEGYITVEGNAGDRNNLSAWHGGDALVEQVASVNKNTIVVVNSVGPITMEGWIDHPNVTALVWSGLPGQEAGNAVADVLFGAYNPGAKLPFTIGKSASDYPTEIIANGNGIVPIPYTEGLFIDYRHFDSANIAPRFEFGFGLSYTTFEYTDLTVTGSTTGGTRQPIGPGAALDPWLHDSVVTVSFTLTNNGTVAGTEVPQLYLSPPASTNSAPLNLKGFDSVPLAPGQSTTVSFSLSRYSFATWDVPSQSWQIPTGVTGIAVGASSRDIRLRASFTN